MSNRRAVIVLGTVKPHAPKAGEVDLNADVASGPKAIARHRVTARLTVDEATDLVAHLLEAIERADRLERYRLGEETRPAGGRYGDLFRPRTTAELEPYAARALEAREARLTP